MKKAYKILSLLFVLVIAASSLGACAPAATQAPPVSTQAPPPTQATAPTQASGQTGPAQANTAAFDEFPRPRIKADGKLTVAYIIRLAAAESQSRSYQQAQIDTAHRGWTFVPLVIQNSSEVRDAVLNAINQDVDVILLGNQESMPSFADVVAQARNKGIGVYNNDNQNVAGIIANSTMPNGVSAEQLIYKIGEDHNWTGSIGFLEMPTIQVSNERIGPMIGTLESYPGMKVLGREDLSTDPAGYQVAANNITKAWLTKYGSELTGVIAFFDMGAMSAGEAIAAAGDPTGEHTFTAGIDGGTEAWAAIRNNTPFQYSYAQPFELYTHKLFDLMDQIQVQGINPGDPGSMIDKAGATLYSTGIIVTRANVPAIGSNVHALYDYYGGDPNDTNAWYNWTDGPGVYKITGGQ
jgi:hypothetical protein